MSDPEIMAILREIQITVTDIRAEQRNQSQVNRVIRQSIRLHKTALNDFEQTRVSAGEIAAIHEDLNTALGRIDELSVEIDKLKRRSSDLP
jgi:uncharacterized coiled-coil DUF342 family protein